MKIRIKHIKKRKIIYVKNMNRFQNKQLLQTKRKLKFLEIKKVKTIKIKRKKIKKLSKKPKGPHIVLISTMCHLLDGSAILVFRFFQKHKLGRGH